jgi:hypothetical protein
MCWIVINYTLFRHYLYKSYWKYKMYKIWS